MNRQEPRVQGTTILAVRRDGKASIGGDGQVTFGQTVVKRRARKIQRLHDGQVLAGFSGATADALALIERFEEKLKGHGGNMAKAAVELARDWRSDRVLRRFESLLVVADRTRTLLVSGSGDVIEPDDGVIGVGSGGPYAAAAAKALLAHTTLAAREIVEASLRIAAGICIYSNDQIVLEEIA